MTTMTHTNRRAARGTLIVRASAVAVGLAASVDPQFTGYDDRATVRQMAGSPSNLCAADANSRFVVL
jgi:hypothetical protein